MDPIDNIENYKLGIFYFNKTDKRIIVQKRLKWAGWTLNFARFESYLIIIFILSIPVIVRIIK